MLPSLHLLKSVLLFNLFVSHFFLFLFLLRSLLLPSTLYLFFHPFLHPPLTATAVFDVLVSPLNCYTHSLLKKKKTVGGGKRRSEMGLGKVFLVIPGNFSYIFTSTVIKKHVRPAGFSNSSLLIYKRQHKSTVRPIKPHSAA